MNIEITLDENTPARDELMDAIKNELSALDVGQVSEITSKEEKGKLDIDPETLLVILKLVYWSIKAVRSAIDLIRELWEKHKVEKSVIMKKSKVEVSIRGKHKHTLSLPCSESKLDAFLDKIENEEVE